MDRRVGGKSVLTNRAGTSFLPSIAKYEADEEDEGLVNKLFASRPQKGPTDDDLKLMVTSE